MSYLIGAVHYQIKASDDVILQHITLSQFYTTVKICYAFSVCSYVKKFQNFKSDKNILLTYAVIIYLHFHCTRVVSNFPEFPLY